ncbi:ATP-binding protein [Desulfovibrio ferrophilus]|uniref:histidine kinase n=1 Tax=Desulfovibrio ferrophilus TaxID=241368 RepID=A0A2Z6B2W4_9BACT|nr:ATP-binding protein [Desulfovibrio ferrophilus]BBD09831.1 multi-sensor signal transduction histidine kinase [Desulfovibrio ferrophilus]
MHMPIPFLNRLKFQDKINLGTACIVIFFGLITALSVTRVSVDSILEGNRERGTSMARNLALRAIDPMLGRDSLRLKNLVDQMAGLSDYINYAFVLDRQGDVLAHTFKKGFPVELKDANEAFEKGVRIQLLDTGEARIYDFAAPVIIGGDRYGTVRLGISQVRVQTAKREVMVTIFGITAAVTLAAMVLSTIFARGVAKSINLLRESAEEVVRGNLDVQTAKALGRNCWEVMRCYNKGCPAYHDDRHRCWYLAGTLCPECQDVHLPEKFESCRTCKVYRENVGDEIQSLAETFDVMALTLNAYIDELKHAKSDLERQKSLMQTILDVTPDLVSLQDRDLKYIAVNKAFCTYFHKNESDVIGITDFDIFNEEQADTNYHEDQQILITGQSLSKQILVGRTGNRRWFHIIKVPVYDGETIIGLLLTARDISVIKQYQERLIHSQKMQDLGKLAGGVAHEINTPLGIILGYAQLLIEDVPEGEQMREDLKIIERQTKVCRKIVSDLLGFSRNIESSMESMELNKSLTDVVELVQHIFRQERVTVDTDLDPNVPPIVADEDKLKQVWMNLLNNAFDAIGSDGHILVGTKLCSHRRRVLVTVADTGSGIKEGNMGRVFDPFFTTKPAGEGTGLGLSVSFGIITDHGGKISVTSPAPVEYLETGDDKTGTRPPGPGTLFIIELPLTKEGLPDEECPEAIDLKSGIQAV